MDEINIIFWVCVVEAWIGHLPWTVPLVVFGVAFVIALFVTSKEQKEKEELREILKRIQERQNKNED